MKKELTTVYTKEGGESLEILKDFKEIKGGIHAIVIDKNTYGEEVEVKTFIPYSNINYIQPEYYFKSINE